MTRNGSLHKQHPARMAASHLALARLFVPLWIFVLTAPIARAQDALDLGRLSLEELSELEVTSVFKRPEPVSRSPAAVYVITHEEIRRSGATSLPEALRLAPNLQVARLDAISYAISARGFNTFEAANKLLVLIDGRSVYTPLHAGVYWDQQQVPLHDIERIEVISGPGGTLWGANAVNGVINIITRSAWHSEGGAFDARVGSLDHNASASYSGRIGESGAFRVYGLGYDRGQSVASIGTGANDDWHGLQAGFRTDWQYASDTLTVQGDTFDNSFESGSNRGSNLLSRWTRQLEDTSRLEVQVYYDKVERTASRVLDSLESFDGELQHTFTLSDIHQIVWGAGHRVTRDKFINDLNAFALVPAQDTVQLSNVFLQDTIYLTPTASLTLGSKLEYSNYTGLEFLPSARVGWQTTNTTLLWAAISRATRTPSRIDRDLTAPGLLEAASQFDSEEVLAYELGYRGQPRADVSLSVSLFYNDYDELRMLTVSQNTGLLRYDNAMHGHTYGVELWGDYQVLPWWRLSAGLNLLEKDLEPAENAFVFAIHQHAGNDPEHQLFLRSSMDLPRGIELDIAARAIDDLPDPAVPSYVAVDARLGWRLGQGVELALAGFNLLDDRHPETGALPLRREIRRSGHFQVLWHFN